METKECKNCGNRGACDLYQSGEDINCCVLWKPKPNLGNLSKAGGTSHGK